MPRLNALRFDTGGMTLDVRPPGKSAWRTAEGDTVELSVEDGPPAFHLDPAGLQRHREEFANAAVAKSAGLVELDLTAVSERPALRFILKMVQQPTGRIYIGSLKVLFRNFSYMVRVVCYEQGTTGVRETVLVHRFLDSGQVHFSAEGVQRAKAGVILGPEYMDGWLVNWLNEPVPAHLARTIGEERTYDIEFPNHPLSRARRLLAHVQATARLEHDLLTAPPYADSFSQSWRSRIARIFGAA